MSARIVLWGSLHGRQYGSPLDRSFYKMETGLVTFTLRIRDELTPALQRAARSLNAFAAAVAKDERSAR